MSTNTPPISSHGDLVLQAKQNQRAKLRESAHLSHHLTRTLKAIVSNNSTNQPGSNCSVVLDKITTVHQLDQEIDRQLREDVSANFASLIESKHRLDKAVDKCRAKLGKPPGADDRHTSVDGFQARCEIIDQNLRILENCLKNVKSNK